MRCARVAGTIVTALLLAGCALADVPDAAGDGTAGSDTPTMRSADLVGQLRPIARGAVSGSAGDSAYLQGFASGTNVLAVIPGTDLSGEYVMIGAHYDRQTDDAGVAVVLAVARAIAGDDVAPRRSVIVALWDGDGGSSAAYIEHPVVALADTVAYVNLDIQGADVLPSLRTTTFAIGAESGGPRLSGIVRRAGATRGLHTTPLSAVFGEYRTDDADFHRAGVPSIFFRDATGPCAHAATHEVDIVDSGALRVQIITAVDIVQALADASTPPSFVADPPLATFDDLLAFKAFVDRAWSDRDLFAAQDRANFRRIREDTARLAAAGRAAFTGDDVTTVLLDATIAQTTLTHLRCTAFLRPA